MASTHSVLGVRHHGPGSGRLVSRALELIRPDAVLVEGPPEASEVLSLAGHRSMKPPVALLVFDPARPEDSAVFPFAEFSPEWQAIRWALKHKAHPRFIDLPCALRRTGGRAPSNPEDDGADRPESLSWSGRDPLDRLSEVAGHSDGEGWWGRLIEERRDQEDPIALFDEIRGAMGAARQELGPGARDADEPLREAHMRRSIRAARKEGFRRIAVICGAWHAPALTEEAIEATSARQDEDLLKGHRSRRTEATWIPWTYHRLTLDSGYGAGVASPGWYEHLWLHQENLTESWLTRVARLMREEDLEAPPASVIEAARLAESLAALRGRSIAGLEEFADATLAILCHGNPLPMHVIKRKLVVGDRLGRVPDDAPQVPLQRDLAAHQRRLRLQPSSIESLLDLDLRKATDLDRSRLLHRLAIVGIPWGEPLEDHRRRASTFHEVWTLQWKPEFAVRVMEAARWGMTVLEAASAFAAERARRATGMDEVAGLLEHALLADLPGAVDDLLTRIGDLAAVASDVGHLMDALPPLAGVLRYGNVRRTDAALVEPVVAGLLARICVGLLPACASLDDEAARSVRERVDAVQSALSALDRAELAESWLGTLKKVGDADIHGLIAGRAWRLLLDAGAASPEDAARRLMLALSPGNEAEKAAAWLEGFLGNSGMVLIHDDRLLRIVDSWVGALGREHFERICPIVRRTFATFEKPERRRIGEKLRQREVPGSAAPSPVAEEYDARRGGMVDPVLKLILGDRMP